VGLLGPLHLPHPPHHPPQIPPPHLEPPPLTQEAGRSLE